MATGQPAPAEFLQEVTSFAQQKGFIWGPSPEIYGGLSGFYDYGPLGKLLKNNVEQAIRDTFQVHDFWEVECPTILPSKVWEASGHVGSFTDPLIVCSKCKANFRVDKLIEELYPDERITDPAKYLEKVEEKGLTCPSCAAPFVKEIKRHSLMMKTTIGLDIVAYNRPETATTTYLPFPRYFEFFRKKLPFGVFQIGKAYRNEISPRQFVLRMREFTQAEGQLFIFQDQKQGFDIDRIKDETLPFWPASAQQELQPVASMTVGEALEKGLLKNAAYAYTVWLAHRLFLNAGIPAEKMRLRQHGADEKAFYADDAWDLEVQLHSFSWTEMCGIHDRTTYDLSQHAKFSGKDLSVSDETHKKELPHVLEIAFGVDRITFALLDLFYNPQDVKEGKTTFHIPMKLAPVKVCVFPLMKKDGLGDLAYAIYEDLSTSFVCRYDVSGSVGRRYLRAAEEGTPYCVTVDYTTKEDGTVTLRDRDSEAQVRLSKDELSRTIRRLLAGRIAFADAGTPVEAKKEE